MVKANGSTGATSSAAAARADGPKKTVKKRKSSFKSYIQQIVKKRETVPGKNGSITNEALEIIDTVLENFLEQLADKCKTLADQRGAKTVGPDQVNIAAQLIFGKADHVVRDADLTPLKWRALVYYRARVEQYETSMDDGGAK